MFGKTVDVEARCISEVQPTDRVVKPPRLNTPGVIGFGLVGDGRRDRFVRSE